MFDLSTEFPKASAYLRYYQYLLADIMRRSTTEELPPINSDPNDLFLFRSFQYIYHKASELDSDINFLLEMIENTPRSLQSHLEKLDKELPSSFEEEYTDLRTLNTRSIAGASCAHMLLWGLEYLESMRKLYSCGQASISASSACNENQNEIEMVDVESIWASLPNQIVSLDSLSRWDFFRKMADVAKEKKQMLNRIQQRRQEVKEQEKKLEQELEQKKVEDWLEWVQDSDIAVLTTRIKLLVAENAGLKEREDTVLHLHPSPPQNLIDPDPVPKEETALKTRISHLEAETAILEESVDSLVQERDQIAVERDEIRRKYEEAKRVIQSLTTMI